jgi:hypothetical protein
MAMTLRILASGLLFAAVFATGWAAILYYGFGACFECALSAMRTYAVVGGVGSSLFGFWAVRSRSRLAARVRDRLRRPHWRVAIIGAVIWSLGQGAVAYFVHRSFGRALLVGLLIAMYFIVMVSLLVWLYRGSVTPLEPDQ